jgi:hypothetical protein
MVNRLIVINDIIDVDENVNSYLCNNGILEQYPHWYAYCYCISFCPYHFTGIFTDIKKYAFPCALCIHANNHGSLVEIVIVIKL